MSEDRRLVRLTKLSLALPEARRELEGRHARFHVRNKTFAWYLSDHHGDGMVSVSCKMPVGENREVAALDPARYYLPAYMSHRGWIALRLDVGKIDWDEVQELVSESYRLIAPSASRRLVAPREHGLDVDDGSAVDRFQSLNSQPEAAIDREDPDAVQSDRIGPVGGAGCKDTREWIPEVVSGMDFQHRAVGFVEPGENDDLMACLDAVQAGNEILDDFEPRVRSPFETLLRCLRALRQPGADPADRANLEAL